MSARGRNFACLCYTFNLTQCRFHRRKKVKHHSLPPAPPSHRYHHEKEDGCLTHMKTKPRYLCTWCVRLRILIIATRAPAQRDKGEWERRRDAYIYVYIYMYICTNPLSFFRQSTALWSLASRPSGTCFHPQRSGWPRIPVH